MVGFFVSNAVNRADGTTSVPVENCQTQREAEALAYIRAGQTLQKINSGEYLTGAVVAYSSTGFVFFNNGWTKDEPEPEPEPEANA